MAASPPILAFLRPLSLPRPATLRHFLRFSTNPRCSQQAGEGGAGELLQDSSPSPKTPPASDASARQMLEPYAPPPTFPAPDRPAAAAAARHPAAQEDPNLLASRRAPSTYPPTSMPSLPRPRLSHASHRTSHPSKPRPQPPKSHLSTPPPPLLAAHLSAPNLPYFVSRTPSAQLPVYTLLKRGGSLRQTRVRKVDGEVGVLRDELRRVLGLAGGDAVVNARTGHVVLKGKWKGEVERFLTERRF